MTELYINIPNWFLTVFLTLMTVSIVASVIDIVLKIQIKKNQAELDKSMKLQVNAWKASKLHDDMRG